MQGCTDKTGFDLDGIQSRVGSVQGSMRRFETMSARFKNRLDGVMFEDVPALLDEVSRLRKLEAGISLEIATKRRGIEILRAEYRKAWESDRDMAANNISEAIDRQIKEVRVLERVIGL